MITYGITLDWIRDRCMESEGNCLIWTQQCKGGRFPYPVVHRNALASGKRGSTGVRRIAFFLGHGKDPGKLWIKMHCQDTRCLNPQHMILVHRSVYAKGKPRQADHAARAAEGRRKSPATKLNLEKAREIRRRLDAGELGYKLAAEFGVTKHMVSNIKRGKAWREPSPFRL